MIKVNGTRVRFTRNGYRFAVTSNNVCVSKRDYVWGTEYELNSADTSEAFRSTYDSRRYQISKNADAINAIQTVLNS